MPPNWLTPNLWIINYIWVSTLDLNPLLSLAMSLKACQTITVTTQPSHAAMINIIHPHPGEVWILRGFQLDITFPSHGSCHGKCTEGLEEKLLCKSQTNVPKSAYTLPASQQSLAKSSPWIFSLHGLLPNDQPKRRMLFFASKTRRVSRIKEWTLVL